MSFVPGNFLDGDGADAGGFVDVDKLLGRGIRAGDQHVTEQNRERFVADKVASNENGVAKPERFLLPRVAELQHVADFSNHLGLIFFPFLFQKTLERRRRIEMIFDGILAFAGDDNDVLDSRRDALFGDVLNLRLVDDGEHLFGLRFGGGKEARAEAGGREHGLSNFLMRVHAISRRSVRNGGRICWHSLSFSEARKRPTSFLTNPRNSQRFCTVAAPRGLVNRRGDAARCEPSGREWFRKRDAVMCYDDLDARRNAREQKMSLKILGIESSCDETAAAVVA